MQHQQSKNMQNTHAETIKKLIAQFVEQYKRGQSAWLGASKTLVRLVDLDPDVFPKIVAQSDGIKIGTLVTFEALGRGKILIDALIDSGHGAKRVISSGLPLKKQKEIYANPVPVVRRIGKETKTEWKRVSELTSIEASLAICNDGIRPPAEQAKILLANNRKKEVRYEVDTIGVVFFERTQFTWAELETVLSQRPKMNGHAIASAMRQNQLRA